MMFHPTLRHKARAVLEHRGVTIQTGKIAKKITPQGVECANGEQVDAGTVIWAAGVAPRIPALTPDAPRGKGGRLLVDPFFRLHKTTPGSSAPVTNVARDADVHAHGQVEVWPNVFVLGDAAAFTEPSGTQLPMLAQIAVRQAPVLAQNVIRSIRKKPLKAFTFRSKGQLVSLGRFQAIAQIGPLHLSGPLAWFLWRNTYFWNFPSWNKRFKIATDWFVNLFFPRDISQA
jgi:NADH dehydrogenase